MPQLVSPHSWRGLVIMWQLLLQLVGWWLPKGARTLCRLRILNRYGLFVGSVKLWSSNDIFIREPWKQNLCGFPPEKVEAVMQRDVFIESIYLRIPPFAFILEKYVPCQWAAFSSLTPILSPHPTSHWLLWEPLPTLRQSDLALWWYFVLQQHTEAPAHQDFLAPGAV